MSHIRLIKKHQIINLIQPMLIEYFFPIYYIFLIIIYFIIIINIKIFFLIIKYIIFYSFINRIIASSLSYQTIKLIFKQDRETMKHHLINDFPIIRKYILFNYGLYFLLSLIIVGTMIENHLCTKIINFMYFEILIILCIFGLFFEIIIKLYIIFFCNPYTLSPYAKLCLQCLAGSGAACTIVLGYGSISPAIIEPNTVSKLVHPILYGFVYDSGLNYLLLKNIKQFHPQLDIKKEACTNGCTDTYKVNILWNRHVYSHLPKTVQLLTPMLPELPPLTEMELLQKQLEKLNHAKEAEKIAQLKAYKAGVWPLLRGPSYDGRE